jgi:hypothetical protein
MHGEEHHVCSENNTTKFSCSRSKHVCEGPGYYRQVAALGPTYWYTALPVLCSCMLIAFWTQSFCDWTFSGGWTQSFCDWLIIEPVHWDLGEHLELVTYLQLHLYNWEKVAQRECDRRQGCTLKEWAIDMLVSSLSSESTSIMIM